MPKQDAQTCWEYFGCKIEVRDKCPAYLSPEDCWHAAGQYCGRVTDKRGMEKCFTCDWYRLRHARKKDKRE